jgi:hypothetical protein
VSHLDEAQLIEAMEGGPAAEHARSCAACGERVGQLAQMLQVVREADVPEPPPFYWASLRRQIGRRIEDEPAAGPRVAPWVGLAALAAAAGLAVVLLRAPGTTPGPQASAVPQVALPSWSALPDDDADGALLGVLDPASADLQAEACDDVSACVAGMSEEESQQLVGLLREEMGGKL